MDWNRVSYVADVIQMLHKSSINVENQAGTDKYRIFLRCPKKIVKYT